MWPYAGLVTLVVLVLLAHRQPLLRPLFHWLPIPLWCYLLPLLAVSIGWLPHESPAAPLYRPLTGSLLPLALALLLLGVDVPAVMRAGARALLAALVGAVGIILGTTGWAWILRAWLPAQAWKGAGSLAATWTGGTLNLLAMRTILNTPDAIFAPLVIVDALVAYGWMAFLVALSGWQPAINRWLRCDLTRREEAPVVAQRDARHRWSSIIVGLLIAILLAAAARALALRLPTGQFVSSANGWTVLLVTTAALGLALIAQIRRIGTQGAGVGYFFLYMVLAATGAQANLEALRAAPAWLLLGLGTVMVHGVLLLAAGRLWRIPLGLLAVASQANVGGVVSAPLVGAVYEQSLAPVGLLLAVAGNALGTYLGLIAATLARMLASTS